MQELAQYCHQLDGKNIYYSKDGNGPIILFIHGSLCDYRYWRWQFRDLAADHTLIAPSLRGCWPDHDENHPTDKYNVLQHAQDLAELAKAMFPGQKIHVLGHSRGAQVAMQMYFLAPESCASLILADPGFRFTDEPKTKPFYADATHLLEQNMVDQALEQFIDSVNGEQTWQKMVPWFKDMARDNAMTLLSQINEANFAFSNEQVQAIRCPVLLVNGKNSPPKYQYRNNRIQQLLPEAQRSQIALSSHGMNLANPRSFNRAVADFVSSVGQ